MCHRVRQVDVTTGGKLATLVLTDGAKYRLLTCSRQPATSVAGTSIQCGFTVTYCKIKSVLVKKACELLSWTSFVNVMCVLIPTDNTHKLVFTTPLCAATRILTYSVL